MSSDIEIIEEEDCGVDVIVRANAVQLQVHNYYSNYTAYYIMFCPKDIRMLGYENHLYDGQDMKRLNFWWFAFVSHIDRYNK